MHKLLPITFTLMLSSCLGPQWVSDIKSPELLNRDKSNCQVYAYEKFPANLYTVNITKYHEMGINNQYSSASNAGIHSSSHSSSHSQNILLPYITQETKDAHSTPRNHAFEKCMIENGWYRAY